MQSAEEEVLRNQGFKASTSETGTSETAAAAAAAQGPENTQSLNGRFVGYSFVLSQSTISPVAKTSAVCLLVFVKKVRPDKM